MVQFKHYVAASTLITITAIAYAVYTRRQFYNATIYLTTNKINIVVLGNLSFLLLLLLGKSVKRLFLGQLTRDEMEDLVQNSKYAITETMLALTIFREEFNGKLLVLFTGLLFMKIFHWLCAMRVESIARTQEISTLQHIRLCGLIGLLAVIDTSFVLTIGLTLLKSRSASVLLLFGFEYIILFVFLASTFFKYVLLVLDARWEARGQHWANKNVWMFYLELSADLIRLFLYLIFFLIICRFYGLPLHLIRELGITFYQLRERIIKFIHFRKLTKNMNDRFPNATAEELAQGDKTCIVCREDMEVGSTKRLPCGHMFHFACLRTWLERSQSCPTCRSDIPINGPIAPPPVPNNPNANVGVAAAAGAAGVGANNAAVAAAPGGQPQPAGGVGLVQPPQTLTTGLPSHLQMQLDALRMTAAAQQQQQQQEVGHNVNTNSILSPPPMPPFHGLLNGSIPPSGTFPPTPFGFPFPMTTSPPPNSSLPPSFLFPPPPPPPPPAHLFNGLPPSMMMPPAPFFPGPAGMPPMPIMQQPFLSPSPFGHGASFPPVPSSTDNTLYGAYLSHHSMLLQHHYEFLSSSLQQVKILIEQQKEMTKKFEAGQTKETIVSSASIITPNNPITSTSSSSGSILTTIANSGEPLTTFKKEEKMKEEETTKNTTETTTITQRQPHSIQD